MRAESFSSRSSLAEGRWFPEKPHGVTAPRRLPGCQKSLGLDNVNELIYQASMEHVRHGDLLGPSVLHMCICAKRYTHIHLCETITVVNWLDPTLSPESHTQKGLVFWET